MSQRSRGFAARQTISRLLKDATSIVELQVVEVWQEIAGSCGWGLVAHLVTNDRHVGAISPSAATRCL